MARDWLWELEAQGIAWRLRGVGHDLLIVPSNRVQELSPSSAATALRRAVTGDPRLAAEALRVGGELQGRAPSAASSGGGGGTPRGGRDQAGVQEALSAIETAMARGDLIALQIQSAQTITEAEIQMLEELRRKRSIPAPPLPPPPPPVEESLHDYPIRVIDDTGASVSEVRLKLEIDGTPRMPTTDADGAATVQWFSKAPAIVRVLDQADVERRLTQRWTSPPSSSLPAGSFVHRLPVGQPFAEVKAPADQQTTLILCRQALYAFEILVCDALGRPLPGVDLKLDVDGQEQSLTTDSDGLADYRAAQVKKAAVRLVDPKTVRKLLAELAASPLPPSNSQTVASQSAASGSDAKDSSSQPAGAANGPATADTIEAVVKPGMGPFKVEAGRQTKIVLKRNVVCIRLVGMHFETAKSFLLPSAMDGIKKIVEVYKDHPDANLLVVGHTDRHYAGTGDGEAYNRKLSLERAKAIAAYLTDNVGTWYAWYGVDDREKRWGLTQDGQMLSVLPDGADPYFPVKGKPLWKALHEYQDAKGLARTDNPDSKTRHGLIADYMAIDGTSLPPGATVTSHGCGRTFPANPTQDEAAEAENRRVEIFVFDGPISPPPPGDYSMPGSTEYGQWCQQVTHDTTFDGGATTSPTFDVRLHDLYGKPMSNVPFRVTMEATELTSGTSGSGWVLIPLPPMCPEMVTVEWGERREDGSYRFVRELQVMCNEGGEREQAAAKLANLGYPSSSDDEFALAVQAFQARYNVPEYGLAGAALPPLTKQKLWSIYDECDATCHWDAGA